MCVCVCVRACQEQKKGLRHNFGSAGAVAGLCTGLVAQSVCSCVCLDIIISKCVCLCVALCCGMLNRISGDLVRSSWYWDHGTAACMSVYVCVACIIGLAVTWCGTVGVLV